MRIAIAPMLVRRMPSWTLAGSMSGFGSEGFADDDFCLRLAHSGRRAYIAGDVYIHRQGPEHPLQGEPERVRILDGEARRMCTKWGLDDPMAAHPRKDLLGLVEVGGKRVLDITGGRAQRSWSAPKGAPQWLLGLRRIAGSGWWLQPTARFPTAEPGPAGTPPAQQKNGDGSANETHLHILRSLKEADRTQTLRPGHSHLAP